MHMQDDDFIEDDQQDTYPAKRAQVGVTQTGSTSMGSDFRSQGKPFGTSNVGATSVHRPGSTIAGIPKRLVWALLGLMVLIAAYAGWDMTHKKALPAVNDVTSAKKADITARPVLTETTAQPAAKALTNSVTSGTATTPGAAKVTVAATTPTVALSGDLASNVASKTAAPTARLPQLAAVTDSTASELFETKSRMLILEAQLLEMRRIVESQQARSLPVNAVNKLATSANSVRRFAHSPVARPAATYVVVPTPPPPPVVAKIAGDPQVLSVDMWDGKPSVIVGTTIVGDKRVQVLQPGDTQAGITLQSADVKGQNATFLVNGKAITLSRSE